MTNATAEISPAEELPEASAFPPHRAKIAGSDWFDYQAVVAGDDVAQRQLQALRESLASVVSADQLVILAGLGTSLGLQRSTADGEAEDVAAPTMGTLFTEIAKLAGFEQASVIAPDSIERGDVEGLLSACQFQLALNGDPDISRFVRDAEAVILSLCSFIDGTTDLISHEVFLRKIARRQTRLSRTQVFTTNYDLAFEQAAERIRFHVIDGFGFGNQRAFDGSSFDMDIVRRRRGETLMLEPNVFHLLKLHGSVDWDEEDGEVRRVSMPRNPVLIYPSQDKYQLSFRPPYLESMSRFQMALRQPDVTLVVVGFGFNDAHIVAPIEAAIRSNIGLRVVVVGPELSTTGNATVQRLQRLLASGDRRITLVETTFREFSSLLPDTSPQDDRELHDDRAASVWASK
jgi:hypothetical protein|tara:strand:+ start:944 stop:2152 length:1209 start_codon:yes stop_codon:yes gene_type:complete